MLTGDLVRVRIEQQSLRPSFVDPEDGRLLDRALELVTLFRQGAQEQWSRGRLDAAVKDVAGFGIDHKLTRGLGKVLFDRGEFDVETPLDPAELRKAAFVRAARSGPLSPHAGSVGRRTSATILAEIAAEHGTPEADLARVLYGDLKEEQVLLRWKDIEPPDLLDRYNLALVQAALLKAESMVLRLVDPAPKELRGLVSRLKFHQLMYRLTTDANRVEIGVDGPESLFKSTTKYGLQLASFVPAMPLLGSPWKVEALLRWGKRRLRKTMVITSNDGLTSHLEARGTWRSQAELWFEERFQALESGWSLGPGRPLDLGGQDLVVPDFRFEKDGRVAHLDIVGFWRKAYLDKRLASLPDNVILAVSKKLVADKANAMPKRVLPFGEAIPPKDVLRLIESLARPDSPQTLAVELKAKS